MNGIRNNQLKIATFLAILFLSLQGKPSQGQNCQKLEDGRYKVKFKKRDDVILWIDKDRFTQFGYGEEARGKIEVNGNCILRLVYLTKWDTLNMLQTGLSRANHPYFIFEKTDGKRLRFRLTGYGGPHVTAGEGIFVRID